MPSGCVPLDRKSKVKPDPEFMKWLKVTGIVLIVLACLEMFNIVSEYASGKLESWPFGTEIGAGLIIALGVFLIKRANRQSTQIKL
jgi:hypothetical protein